MRICREDFVALFDLGRFLNHPCWETPMKLLSVLLVVLTMLATVDAGAGKKLKVCLVSGSLEYDSDHSLAVLQAYLEKNYPIKCSRAFRKTDTDIPGLDNLDTCDVMVLFTRRLKLEGADLERFKKYCLSGKPIVGIRTASHAMQTWLDLDKDVLGGNYKGHFGEKITCQIKVQAKDHPILKGVKLTESQGSLYKNTGLAKDVDILLTGSIPEHTEPIAWTRMNKGGRIFYTSLGHQKDFEDENFLRFLANAITWTTQK
jgi:type 1 glutamine amidotransferase